MPIEFRRGRNGKLRPTWYGRYEVRGRRHTLNLGVRIAGTPPESLSLKDEGDAAFERSRERANACLNKVIEDARNQHNESHLARRIYEIKTGEQVNSLTLDQLPQEWENISRKRKPNARYADQCKSTLHRFGVFVQERHGKAQELGHVTKAIARAFMDAESSRGVSAKTWNDTLKLLRATFKHLMPDGALNPFDSILTRETETIFRKPFSPHELMAIISAVQMDDFIRPVIITGVFTAMRRGDCCLLKWTDVDLDAQFISVKTSKTGQQVSIPIFPLLNAELQRHGKGQGGGAGFVFPKQAAMYQENPDGITWRVRKVFAAAGFKDASDDEVGEVRGEIHSHRANGLRRASVRDFHSFRVTWVTLALTANIPLEIVQKVTGHKTAEIVLKHYFQPGREVIRETILSAMPELIPGPAIPAPANQSIVKEPAGIYGERSSPLSLVQTAIKNVEQMNGRNWKEKRELALESLKSAEQWLGANLLHENETSKVRI